MSRRITLLTDFGTVDGYVGEMRGVLATEAPAVWVEDVSHDLAQGDIHGAARALGRYWAAYPAGTVHLVVVDPGVGTDRRALAVEAAERFVIAPDNGLVSPVLDEADRWSAVSIAFSEREGRTVSATFHGRDVFAPAAARLASGEGLRSLGPVVTDPVRLETPAPHRDARGGASGRVVGADRFGNLLTDLPGSWLGRGRGVRIADRAVRRVRTYAEGEAGEPVALVGSAGRVEIAVNGGSAETILNAKEGMPVRITAPEPEGED